MFTAKIHFIHSYAKNCLMLSETQVTYQKASDILNEFLEQNQTENFDLLKESLVENINLIRYVYSTLPKNIQQNQCFRNKK